MILDLAHASSQVVADVAMMAREGQGVGPVVVSHTGVRRTCDRDRNLSDEDIRNVARAGGVIGIGFWTWVACWEEGEDLASIRTKVSQSFADAHDVLSDGAFAAEMGEGYDPVLHLALGSDFDGATTMPVDVAGIPWLLEGIATAERGGRAVFEFEDIRAIAGGNLHRIIQQALPSAPPDAQKNKRSDRAPGPRALAI